MVDKILVGSLWIHVKYFPKVFSMPMAFRSLVGPSLVTCLLNC